MTLFASLNGVPIHSGDIEIPAVGIWHADLTLADDGTTPTTGPLVLALGGATYACTAIRATAFAGRTELRAVGGAAGWRKVIPAKAYGQVTASAVIADAAATAGELANAAPGLALSLPAYARTNDAASKVLQDLFPDAWWVDFTGTLQLGPRASAPIGSQFDVLDVEGRVQRWTIATDTPGDWIPGATFTGPTVAAAVTISRVKHKISPDKLRTVVWQQ